ncbi:hypothetical protein H3H36_16720 [Duganella sp. FT3S]|uniref:Uncharacterized protein n=1 Tax=Rugamonas fusca TaxID=2758568 RepID=A0A7W2EJM2_9BURK|nr:hypothetical protein [Rugamonas fusca]MBA5607002.1 hypothetical protein [Rugamonas fusca]
MSTPALRQLELFGHAREACLGWFLVCVSSEDGKHVAYSHAFRESMGNTSLPNTAAPIDTRHAQDNLVLAYTRLL